MDGAEAVREVVDRETRAWDTQDVELLLTVFHPDMVWPWPRTYTSVDPADWQLVIGRFDASTSRRKRTVRSQSSTSTLSGGRGRQATSPITGSGERARFTRSWRRGGR